MIASLALLSVCVSCASGPNLNSTTPIESGHKLASSGSLPADELLVEQQLSTISDGAQRYALLDKLSTNYFREGKVADSMRIREKIAYDSHITAGQRSLAASDLANSYAIASDFVHSDRMLQQAKYLARRTSPAELEQLKRNPAYFELYAESEFERRYMNRQDLALSARRTLLSMTWGDLNNASLSEHRRHLAADELFGDLSELIRTMVENNRRMEALSYASEMRWAMQTLPDLHLSAYQRGEVDHALAIALSSNDDYDGAMAAINAALQELQKSDLSPNSVGYSEARRARLMIALVQGRIREHAADADGWESAAAVNPVVAKNEGSGERASLILASRGQWKEADTKITASMAGALRRYGAGSPFYKTQAALKTLYELNDPDSDITTEQIIKYASEIIGSSGGWDASSTAGSLVVDGALELSMKKLMAGSDTDRRMAFRIAEFFHTNATYGAMADGAARLAASNPALRTLVEQEQETLYQQNTARLALTLAVSQLSSSRNGGSLLQQSAATSTVKREQSALGDVDEHLASIRKQIEKEFPTYKELVAPELPDPAVLGSSLRRGEAYIDFYAARDEAFAFVVRPDSTFKAARLPPARADLKKAIIALRTVFDAGSPPQARPGGPSDFNLAASVSLYQSLIAPIADEIRGAEMVYIVTSGPLASTPFDVLVTEPTERLESAKWWINSIAPVRLPSGSALVIARAHPAPNASQPFIAFADPSFSGPAQGFATEDPEGFQAAEVAAPARSHFEYRRVARLPETLDEARSIATALGAPQSSIVSGAQATRSSVLKADLSMERVVLFATHGVIPGQLPDWHKSGLALAYEGNGLQDSILSADDIVTLRLNADWVVLSACNTGLASGNAGDAVSELSRAFFAAGARTMLVTQWAVESRSAADITTTVFKTFSANSSLSKAEALAQAERDMLNGKNGALFRHPYYWGAYVLNGDGAR